MKQKKPPEYSRPGAPIDVIGRSCRLPGANDVSSFWDNLVSGRCTIGAVKPKRFSMFRYRNPRPGEPGKSYTFAAGLLDDIWGFDPAVFAISPREAEQMDPQQRLLLMLVWEALEDAGLPPSTLAEREVGVYVGNSGIDHNNRFFFDPAGSDSYMMTGNTGALISNRISYIFNLHGPSMTIDTACSSSLVALDGAVSALRAGRIDTAIVAGVNLLLSPFPFVGFAAASMLSPQGLCRPFDKEAHGYVRAEGGVVLVLQRGDDDNLVANRRYARIVEVGVNSDGRTVGVALPSAEYQAGLLETVYKRAGVDAENLAFIEAHGTGTRVGDPAEATALGRVLGQARSQPLPVGSVKSNIGHLEPASGIAGLLKAMLALENDHLPASLHFETPNPDIPFKELNIEIAGTPRDLERGDGARFAGVSNFGFGGTNVHVVLTDPPPQKKARPQDVEYPQNMLLLSAHCHGALKDLAGQYGTRTVEFDNQGADNPNLGKLINAATWQREHMAERLVVFGDNAEVLSSGLNAFANGAPASNVAHGTALSSNLVTALVYSGNGSQWAGMGRAAFRQNENFATIYRQVDELFSGLAGWSLVESLFAEDLVEQLQSTRIAQPLLFALQVALTEALRRMGLQISGVVGHSVGEVAAAWASGALTLEQAVRIIQARSTFQETIRGKGRMAAVMLSEAETREVLNDEAFSGVEISAVNSSRSVTLAGPTEPIRRFIRHAGRHNWVNKLLDIDYPFHTEVIDPVRDDLVAALKDIDPGPTRLTYYSTVTGSALAGDELTANYWWDNVRQPVRFADAIRAAADDGCRLFMEIGPKPVLKGYLIEATADLDKSYGIIHSFAPEEPGNADPVTVSFARAIATGACFDPSIMFGPDQKADIDLPLYPWQNRPYKLTPSIEALEAFDLTIAPHPLLGQQLREGKYVWNADLDTQVLPFLSDHKVDGKVIMPATAFAEMALAATRQWLASEQIELRDMDIIQPLMLARDHTVQVRTRLSIESGTVEITSRKRLSGDDWQMHAKCRVAKVPGENAPTGQAPDLRAADEPKGVARLYSLSQQFGLEFGPRFQRMIRCDEPKENLIEVVLDERHAALDPADEEADNYVLHPLDLDGCFHGLNMLYDKLETSADKLAFIPVRLGALRIYLPGSPVRTARISILRSNKRGIQADFELFNVEGRLVATLKDARFRAAALVQRHTLDRVGYSITHELMALPGEARMTAAPAFQEVVAAANNTAGTAIANLEEHGLLLDAAARRAAYDILFSLADDKGGIDVAALSEPLALNRADPDDTDGQEIERFSINQRLALISSLLAITEQSGMAELDQDNWRLARDCPLPAAADLMQTLLGEDPRWLAECVLLNRAANLVADILHGRETINDDYRHAQDIYSPPLLEQWASSSPLALGHIARIASVAEQIIAGWPLDRPLRVLELGVGGGGLTRALLPMITTRHGRLIVADTNKTSINRLRILFAGKASFDAVILTGDAGVLDEQGPFDLLFSANGLHMLSHGGEIISDAVSKMVEGGCVIVSTTKPDVFHDVVFGPVNGWFDLSVDPYFPLNPMKQPDEWLTLFKRNGFSEARVSPLSGGLEGANLIIAARDRAPGAAKAAINGARPAGGELEQDDIVGSDQKVGRRIVIAATSQGAEAGFGDALSRELTALGIAEDEIVSISGAKPKRSNDAVGPWAEVLAAINRTDGRQVVDIVHLIGAFEEPAGSETALAGRAQNLTGLLQALGAGNIRLWIIAPGGARALTRAGAPAPAQSGIWAYGRTATNEYGDLDIRLVDFAGELDQAGSAERLATLLLTPGDQSEVVLTRNAMHALKVRRGLPVGKAPLAAQKKDAATVLSHPVSGSLDRLNWKASIRRAPEADEVQLEVAATGLNFRDVMWAQGLLPEEALEDGFAGPTLGFECSGRITAVGKTVTELKIGDLVMALAPASFASHVTVTAAVVVRLPDTFELTAAATIPIAFFTAYYALHHLARLEEDEWVLIHGAAGGVGLAALQVARWSKAKVIATAGSDEKRQFLKMLGADHVLNSRSLDFVDQVREITKDDTGDGVDVVLNSLSGEAMERSLELVRPFGRFLELGKRDFFGNTKIGLRPFRRNLSYFGIDADQLLNHQPKLCKRLFSKLTVLFKAGRFTALPYRLFESGDIIEAFRLMQQSGHIGKIVVKAPPPQAAAQIASNDRFEADSDGSHVIVGGLGGFGLEAARWLADHGARSIVLTSRSGGLNTEAGQVLASLEEAGVTVEVARCDVTDKAALEELLRRLRADRPIKGIMHAAMVLDDALIRNLSPGQIENVLRPKVEGAENLDRLTRDDTLDYFVLFSSAAVLFGNPGQANYVTANGYLDGLAHRRRQEGRPALAVGWGAITDVGVLARHEDTATSLARHTGGIKFTARQGLNLLGQLLVSDTGSSERAAVTLAAMNWTFAADTLPIMQKSTFALMAREAAGAGGGKSESIDILSAIAGLDDFEAQEKIARLLAEEVSAIFRMPAAEINLKRSLAEIGMDSLMGMELHIAAQRKLGIDIPIISIADGATINDMAAKVLARVRNGPDVDDNLSAVGEMLAQQHLRDDLDEDEMAGLADKVRERQEQLGKAV